MTAPRGIKSADLETSRNRVNPESRPRDKCSAYVSRNAPDTAHRNVEGHFTTIDDRDRHDLDRGDPQSVMRRDGKPVQAGMGNDPLLK